jgi:hypothetical protein
MLGRRIKSGGDVSVGGGHGWPDVYLHTIPRLTRA